DHPGRSLLRIRQGQSALSRFHALPLRQRDYAAHVFEGVWTGGRAHRVRVRARRTDPQPAQGEAAVRAINPRAGGRSGGPAWQKIPAPFARTQRAGVAPAGGGAGGDGPHSGAVGSQFCDDGALFGAGGLAHFRGIAVSRGGGASAQGLRPAELPADLHRYGRGQRPRPACVQEELCRKHWSARRRLRRISFRSTARITSNSTWATRARRRISIAPRSAFAWPPIAARRPALANAPPTSWCKARSAWSSPHRSRPSIRWPITSGC